MKKTSHNKTFTLTLDVTVLEQIKQFARERACKQKRDYTYQDVIREMIDEHFKILQKSN